MTSKIISNLKIKHFNGNVKIPSKILSDATSRTEFFKKILNKKSRASLSEKIAYSRAKNNSEIKNSNAYKKGISRKKDLTLAFKSAYHWLPQFVKYFDGCQGVDKIKKLMISEEKMKSAYDKLKNNGDIDIDENTSTPDKSFEEFYDEGLKKVTANYKNKLPAYYLDFIKILTLPLKSGDQHNYRMEGAGAEKKIKWDTISKDSKTTAENMTIIEPKEDTSYKKTENYKLDCINAFQNIKLVFYAYLSIISDIYNYKFQQATKNREISDKQFELNEKKLNGVMSTYEQFISNIKTEIKKHPIYFKYIVKHGDMKKLDKSICEQRERLQNLVDEAKDVLFSAETISYTQEKSYKDYKDLIGTLKLVKDYINNIAEAISQGKDEDFKDNYLKALPFLEDELFAQTKKFQQVEFKRNERHQEQISDCNKKMEKILKLAEEIIRKIEEFEKEFNNQFIEAAKSFAKALVPALIFSGLSVSTIWLDVTKPLGDVVKAFSGAIDETKESLIPVM